jgi:hypothetical protein
MHARAWFLACLAALCAPLPVWGAEKIGVITAIEGTVRIKHADGTVVESAKLKDNVLASDVVETGPDAKVKILFEDDCLIVLGPSSTVEMKEHVYKPKEGLRRFILFLKKGALRSVLEKLYSDASSYRVETHNSVAGVVGTDFVVEYFPGPVRTVVSVIEGKAELKSTFVAGLCVLFPDTYAEVVGEDGVPTPARKIGPELRERIGRLWIDDQVSSRPKSPPQRAASAERGERRQAEVIGNPQVDVVGKQPIFIGGPFGSPAGLPSGGGGGGPNPPNPPDISNRASNLQEYLGGGRH